MTQGTMLYEGKAKKIFATDQPDRVVQYFKDDATAFNAQKRGTIVEKGIVNNKISERLFRVLEAAGVTTHFIERLSDREMLTKRVTIVPIEVVVRNIIAGSLAKRLGLKEGDPIEPPVISEEHVRLMKLAEPKIVEEIKQQARRINAVLQPFFKERKMLLVDFKLEFGLHNGTLMLADEISPDTCRFWDAGTKESMDKDRFRKDLGKIEEAYQEVLRRVCGEGA
jgi:phosphoribosylaminoimidazole-succinocarboxamide synthase